jgi:hypothetical protein
VRLKRFGCDHDGGEVAKAGFPDLLGIFSVKEKPRGKDKAGALPNDLVDSFNVLGRNDYKNCWSR